MNGYFCLWQTSFRSFRRIVTHIKFDFEHFSTSQVSHVHKRSTHFVNCCLKLTANLHNVFIGFNDINTTPTKLQQLSIRLDWWDVGRLLCLFQKGCTKNLIINLVQLCECEMKHQTMSYWMKLLWRNERLKICHTTMMPNDKNEKKTLDVILLSALTAMLR